MVAGTGLPIKPLLYIEGKRMDNAFISASISNEISKPLTAVISLVPTNAIRHIIARTHVVLTCNDPWNPYERVPFVLFEGEVLGIGFEKTDDGRAFIIHCADVSNYWHHVRQYWFNLSQSGGEFLDQFIRMSTGGSSVVPTVSPLGVKGYLIQRLNLVSGEENAFLDSMIGLLDDIGNISSFYLNARRRLRITDRIMRKNAGQVQNLFQFSFFGDWMQQLTQARSGETNLLGMITLLLNIIYHEYVSIIAPPYIESETIKRDRKGNPVRKKDKKGNLRHVETTVEKIVGNFFFKPHIYTLPPPTCNVIFPNMYEGISYNRDFMSETTRMTLTPQVMQNSSLSFLRLKVFKRPQELDSFFDLMTERSGREEVMKKRPESATYGDGQGQSAHVQEFEFMTNEERFKGIVPRHQGLAPAPAMLSLSNQGQKDSSGKRKGGAPRYMHNVASYEYYMRKFSTRQINVDGVFNFRPVVGQSIIFLDPSDANMNIIGYLQGMAITLNAQAGVDTRYMVAFPREVEEIDLNRPIIDAKTGEFEFEIQNGEKVFSFDKMFSSENVPPIPDWFADDFKTVGGLTDLYKSFLGDSVASLEDMRKLNIGSEEEKDFITRNTSDKPTGKILRAAVNALLYDYKQAEKANSEFEYVSNYTERTFTTLNQLFAFLGASPKNYSPKRTVPDADTEYVGDVTLRAFTKEETGEASSTEDSDHAIFDGVPIPHPFETELYEKSVARANKENVATTRGGKTVSPTNAKNAPTGLNVENQPFVPISYPISEKQILEARRSIINLYRQELEEKRGFRG